VLLAAIGQRHREQLGRVEQALHLQAHEFVFALAQGACRAHALLLDDAVQLLAQRLAADADEAPRLHEADAGRVVRRVEQPAQHLGRDRAAREVAHVAPLVDGAVDRPCLAGVERIGHRAQSSMPRCAGMPALNACLTSVISVTVSASSMSSGGQRRPVSTTCTCFGRARKVSSTPSSGSQP
jgi:hypothetical protein